MRVDKTEKKTARERKHDGKCLQNEQSTIVLILFFLSSSQFSSSDSDQFNWMINIVARRETE